MFSWLSLLFPQLRLALIVAAIVGGASVLGGIYWKGRVDARHAAERQQLEAQVSALKDQAAKAKAAAIADQMAAEAAAADVADLEEQIQELTHATANPDTACLDDADVGRLRQLQSRPGR